MAEHRVIGAAVDEFAREDGRAGGRVVERRELRVCSR
jgi:hypothetical protein